MHIAYYKNPTYAIPRALTNIDSFIAEANMGIGCGDTVAMDLEPGDATHYQFIILNQENGYIVACPMTQNWCVMLHDDVFPYCLRDFRDVKANPCTLALICEIMNRVTGRKSQNNYDFKKGGAT